MAQLLDHLHVVFHTFLDALGFGGVTQFFKEGNLFHQVVLYMPDGDVGLFFCCHKEVGRVEFVFVERGCS